MDRSAQIQAFIDSSPYSQWIVSPIPNDASPRRYFRLTSLGDHTVILMDAPLILMDAPPEANCKTKAFIKVADSLSKLGYNVPTVQLSDLQSGLIFISDLGKQTVAEVLQESSDLEGEILGGIISLLLKLENEQITNLSHLTPSVAGEMVGITGSFFSNDYHVEQALKQSVTDAFTNCCGPSSFLSLRDVHAENIIFNAKKAGMDRFGLLDFQDAFYAPQGYDLVSLLRDVRRDYKEETVQNQIDFYIDQTGPEFDFHAQFACLAAQRNLRIVGVLANLVTNQGKRKYLPFVKRAWRHLEKDLGHPCLSQVQEIVYGFLPDALNRLFESEKC